MVSVAVDADDVDFAPVVVLQPVQILGRCRQRLDEGHAESHECDDAVGGATSLRHFTASRAGCRAIAIVGVVAGADDRGVANAPGEFPGPP